MIEAFTQELVSRVTKLSKRQLEYWDATDVIRPSIAPYEGRGEPRLYSFRDLIKLKVAAQMRRKLRPGQMRELMKQLERQGLDDPFVTVTFVETTDGGQIAYIDAEGVPLSAHGREVGTVVETFGLPLKDLRTGLKRDVIEATPRTPGKVSKTRGIVGGVSVIAGTRVPVSKIADLAAAGWSKSRILEAFPNLQSVDIAAAIKSDARRWRSA